jgi:hypothetical protein
VGIGIVDSGCGFCLRRMIDAWDFICHRWILGSFAWVALSEKGLHGNFLDRSFGASTAGNMGKIYLLVSEVF